MKNWKSTVSELFKRLRVKRNLCILALIIVLIIGGGYIALAKTKGLYPFNKNSPTALGILTKKQKKPLDYIMMEFFASSKLGHDLSVGDVKNFDELSKNYKDEIIEPILFSDLNKDGKDEAVVQLSTGASGAFLMILKEDRDRVRELFNTGVRAGTVKIEDSTIYQESYIIGDNLYIYNEIKWNGKDWDFSSSF